MEVSQENLAWLWAGSLLCGFVLAALEDLLLRCTRALVLPINAHNLSIHCLQIYRLIMPKDACEGKQRSLRPCRRFFRVMRAVARFSYDVFFTIAFAVVFILLLYLMNDGRFRLSAAFIMAIGMVIYRLSLGRIMNKAEPVMAIFLQGVLARLIQILSL